MRHVIAIDPGDRHTGLAQWHSSGFRQTATLETEGMRAIDQIRRMLESTSHPPVQRTLVVERFSLYAHKAMEQSGSEFETAQLIGQLKLVARDTDTGVVIQGADIKKPTRRQLKARGIELSAGSGHAKDAELHLIHYLLRENLWES